MQITFSLQNVPVNEDGRRLFAINPDTGEIRTMTSNDLDRERVNGQTYRFIVEAADNGSPAQRSNASVMVTVTDIVCLSIFIMLS